MLVLPYIGTTGKTVSFSHNYKVSRNNKPIYGYMLPNLTSPNLYKVQSTEFTITM